MSDHLLSLWYCKLNYYSNMFMIAVIVCITVHHTARNVSKVFDLPYLAALKGQK